MAGKSQWKKWNAFSRTDAFWQRFLFASLRKRYDEMLADGNKAVQDAIAGALPIATNLATRKPTPPRIHDSSDGSFGNPDVEEQVKLAASSQSNDEDLSGPEETVTDHEDCG